MGKEKVAIVLFFSVISGKIGVLAIPIFILVTCNIIDYATGFMAAPYRGQVHTSYKSFKGVAKKVCMWLLVFLGVLMDIMIEYATQQVSWLNISLPFIVATIVTFWLVFNEIISILENVIDIGVEIPPFLMPLAKNIKTKVEESVHSEENELKAEEQEHEKNVRY